MLTMEKAPTSLGCALDMPNVQNLIPLLQECRKKKTVIDAKRMHVHMCNYGLEAHEELGNYLVPMLVECGDVSGAQQVFHRLAHRNEYCWTSLLQGYVDCGQAQGALDMFRTMQNESVHPTGFTLQALLKACTRLKCVKKGQELHSQIAKEGFEVDPFVGSTLVDMYAKCGFLTEAQDVFDELQVLSTVSWNALVTGYAQGRLGDEVLNCLEKMQLEGVPPNAVTFVCALKDGGSMGQIGWVQEIHAVIAKEGFESDSFVGNTLLDMYGKCGWLVEAQDVFDELPVRNVVAWTALMAGYAEHGLEEDALKCLQKMQLEGVLPNAVTLACCLKACGNIGAIGSSQEIHSKIAIKGFDGDPFIANALVVMYAKCGSLAEAQQVFNELQVRNVVSWTALAAGYAEHGFSDEAISCLEQMLLDDVPVDAVTLVCSLKVCGSIRDIGWGQKLHDEITKEGFEKDLCVGSTLVDLYAKCGLLTEAHEAFCELPVRDVVSWTALISGYVEHGLGEEALTFLDQMQLEGMPLNTITYICILKACGTIAAKTRGQESHAEIAKKGFENDLNVGTNLVDMYVKCGFLEEAREVFDELANRDVVVWTALITGYAEQGLVEEALTCLEQMRMEGVCPNAVTYLCCLKACDNVGVIGRGREIHAEVAKEGFEGDVAVGNALVGMYTKCGILLEAQEVFDEMPIQNTISWTAIIAGYVELGLDERALSCFEQIQLQGMPTDDVTFVCCLRACGNTRGLGRGLDMHAHIAKEGFEKDPFVCNTLIDMYAKCGSLVEAWEVFDELQVRSVVSWTALIAGYVEHGLGEEALNCLEQMELEGVSPNVVTHVCSLQACGSIGALGKLNEIHVKVIQEGLEGNPCVENALVDLYAKCGAFAEAWQVFDKLQVQNVVSWNALIVGYACQGECEVVFSMFEGMEDEGIQVDEITFLSVLTVCSHEGLVSHGREYFEVMSKEYGIDPTIEHYNCMVDLFGRAGQLDEVVAMMETMPFQPDFVMWNTVLAACRKWDNAELGRQAFHCATRIDENQTAAFILMSNIYAHAGMWEDVIRIEELRLQDVRKAKLCEKG